MTQFIRIKDLAKKYELTTRTLRFWEEKGLIGSTFRGAGSRRNYGSDIEIEIQKIQALKARGLSLEQIKEIVDEEKKLDTKRPAKQRVVRILVDSTASISPKLARQKGIDVIPLYVNIGGRSYLDGVNIDESTFYEKIEQSKQRGVALSTAPPTEDDFFRYYGQLIHQGAQTIYSIHISEGFSQTVVNARAAAKRFTGVAIHIMDSGTSGQALLMLALSLQEKIQAGASEQDCLDYVAKLIKENWLVVTITSIKTLLALGALTINTDAAYAGLLAEVLNFRPVLEISGGSPNFKLIKRADQLSEALQTLDERLKNTLKASKLKIKMIGVSHSRLDKEAEAIRQRLEADLKIPVWVQQGSAVLCTHLGPQSLGVNVLFEV